MLPSTAWMRITLLHLWSAVLTALTLVLGSVPLRVLWRAEGRGFYWGSGLILLGTFVAMGWPILAVMYGALLLMVGVFSEVVDDKDHNYLGAAVSALAVTYLMSAGLFVFWMSMQGGQWHSLLLTAAESSLQPLQKLSNGGFDVSAAALVKQAPSAVFILLAVALYLSLWLEAKSCRWFRIAVPTARWRLREFRLPDGTVWVFTLSLLGTFGQFGVEWLHVVSVNIFNISLFLFFLQGFAVVCSFYRNYKVSLFWQVVLNILLILQLFVVVSFVGLADYWFDFRNRMGKKSAELEKNTSK